MAPAHAQTANTQPGQATRTRGTEEIVVTANKRRENINKVGQTVTALSGRSISEHHITSLSDLAAAVPGLTYAQSTTNTPIFTLRGVGFNEASLGVSPAVSVYLDQAPLPFPVMASHTAFDLERIEVLKGPQGTLFGENATGGAINYIAAKPNNDHMVAGGDISYGRFNEFDGNAYIGGPISPDWSYRAAITGLHEDPWQYSYTRSDKLGTQAYVAGRVLLDYHPSQDLHVQLNLNGWNDKSDPQAQQLIAVRPANPAYANPLIESYPFSPDNDRAADWTNGFSPTHKDNIFIVPRSNRNFYQASLRADIALPYDLTLTSITTYDYFDEVQSSDNDGIALVSYDLQQDEGYIHSFNQELRVANSATERLRYILGGNFEDSNTLEYQSLRYADNSTSNPSLLNINDSGVYTKQDIKNYAAFGNIEYDVLHDLTLKGGIRYTQSDNSAYNCGVSPNGGNVNVLFNYLGGVLGKVPFTPIGPDGCYTLNQNLVPGEAFRKSLNENNVSWRVGADYRLAPNALLYANISRGYKSGSFPTLAAANYTAVQPVTQESVTAYEAGFKTQLFNNRLDINAAGFYYKYNNKQIRGKLLDPIFGLLDLLINVPASEIKGGEADITIRPIEGLRLTDSVTYLDSDVIKYDGYNILGNLQDFAGTRLPFTPKWSNVLDGEYRYTLPSGGSPFFGITVNSRSVSDSAFGASEISYPAAPTTHVAPGIVYPDLINGYSLVDLRLGYESADEKWKVMVWGKNVFDQYYWTSVITASDTTTRLTGRPMSYGITLSYKFM